ncbi:MAG: cohesin domain-containing protein [Methylococcaceae bacterium]|jgi:hypothetical protein
MNKYIFSALIALFFNGYVNSAQASLLSIQLPNGTAADTTNKGSSFDVGIYISSIADFGGFDFDLTFDSSKLVVTAPFLTSASVFGPGDATAVFANGLSSPGRYHFAETIDILSDTALSQGLTVDLAPLLLGTLHFQALNTGSNSTISIGVHGSNTILVDFDGNPLGTSVQAANVTINPPAAVPLPAPIWLMLSGVLGLAYRAKAQKA